MRRGEIIDPQNEIDVFIDVYRDEGGVEGTKEELVGGSVTEVTIPNLEQRLERTDRHADSENILILDSVSPLNSARGF